ncbi:glycosyltransferase family 2 protein [Neptuniibacter sp. QD72_48]|uniref:glycosyltransferase family 2 protein n=1 Tax=unclassified Neptuniibacter TaxID=2630693 RepID=UPI0039F56A58
MIILLLSLFALSWVLIIYHHIAYPLIMNQLNKTQTSKQEKEIEEEPNYRSLCIFVPAYNEADFIADKLRNIASLDYPSEKLQVIIACDGCKDRTAEVAREALTEPELAHLNVNILNFRENHGKVALINQIIPNIDAEIVALSDASALISFDALKLVNHHFNNPKTGLVAATYKLLSPGSEGEKQYWNYQTKLKQGEARIGSTIGVHGALYFIRQTLFTPLQVDTINDDFILPMQIIEQGYEGKYDSDLIGLELEASSLDMDHKRRIRIAAGNLQQVLRLTKLLSPSFGGTAFSFFSGKALRGLMPLILLAQFVLCGLLALYLDAFAIFTALQLLGIGLARLSTLIPENKTPTHILYKPFKLGFYVINGYYNGLTGCLRYLAGLEKGHWKSVRD